VLGNPIEFTIAVAHLIFDRVLDQLPLLMYAGRMDHAFRARADRRQHIQRPPSKYLNRLVFDTLVFDQAQLDFLLKQYGADQLCLGSDYPFDMAEPDPSASTRTSPRTTATRSSAATRPACSASPSSADRRDNGVIRPSSHQPSPRRVYQPAALP
jgi:hypothetical protein